MQQFENIALNKYHTFQTSETTEILSILESKEDAIEYFKQLKSGKRLVIGEGSNLLFSKNFHGELLKIENKGIEVVEEKGQWVWVKAAAGENWDDFVAWTVEHGYGGIENLSYIPGTVGAAPVQNIGAYGVEFQDVFNSLEAVDIVTGESRNFYLQEMDYKYRHSIFKTDLKNKYLITSVIVKLDRYPKANLQYGNLKEEAYRLTSKSIPDILDIRNAVIKIRKSKLPETEDLGNAGSFFKNPIINCSEFEVLKQKNPNIVHFPQPDNMVKLAAAWLIDQCGLKGYSDGDAATHEQHALIIINKGNATGKELKQFSELIQEKVFTKFQISLEPEVLIL